jgi:hypothetical protein
MSSILRRTLVCIVAGLALSTGGRAFAAQAEMAQAKVAQPEIATFATLLDEAGLVLEKGHQLVDDVRPETKLYAFQKAVRHRDLPLKIYYAIRPLARMKIDYEDPHSNAPDPNHIFPMVFQALVGRLARHGSSPSRVYPPEKAKALFNADWAAAALFDADPALKSDYRSALLVAIHKNARADAYTLYVFDDPKPVKAAIDDALGSLGFAAPEN